MIPYSNRKAIPALAIALALSACGKPLPDLFGTYTANASGSNVKLLLADPNREMTHARLSHNQQWITFTRYNDKGWDGTASEDGGYANTEIMIMRADGSDVQSIIPPKPGICACNSSWTPDDKGLIFLSNDNPQKLAQIMTIDLATRIIKRIPTPEGFAVTDPHQVGNQFVFPLMVPGQPASLWIMNSDGSNARQLTHPVFSEKDQGKFAQGDYDPRISPDGSKVAFMRLFGKENWRVYVVDIASGQERDLTGPNSINAIPDWSGDNRRLIYWHVDLKDFSQIGLFTMNPDGSDRQMIPLPRGYVDSHPSFFPSDDWSGNARIIYSGHRIPNLP